MNSTNTKEPAFGPQFPVFPVIADLVRVSGPGVLAGSLLIYQGFLQQYTGNLQLRDRVPVYVFEPNNIALGPARYDCRLVGSYLGLPIYATTCCGVGVPFGSSSQPSSSSVPSSPSSSSKSSKSS